MNMVSLKKIIIEKLRKKKGLFLVLQDTLCLCMHFKVKNLAKSLFNKILLDENLFTNLKKNCVF